MDSLAQRRPRTLAHLPPPRQVWPNKLLIMKCMSKLAWRRLWAGSLPVPCGFANPCHGLDSWKTVVGTPDVLGTEIIPNQVHKLVTVAVEEALGDTVSVCLEARHVSESSSLYLHEGNVLLLVGQELLFLGAHCCEGCPAPP